MNEDLWHQTLQEGIYNILWCLAGCDQYNVIHSQLRNLTIAIKDSDAHEKWVEACGGTPIKAHIQVNAIIKQSSQEMER